MRKIFSVMILLMFFLAGCGISQMEAEDIGKTFIRERVKFYGVAKNESHSVETYELQTVSTEEIEGIWQARYLARGTLQNASKEKNITVCINTKGVVVGFNVKNDPC